MTCLPPTSDLAARFRRFARGLYDAIAWYTAEDRSSGPLIGLICKRLTRRASRFGALIARFQAGTLPPPRTTMREHARREGAPRVRAPDPVPRSRGYLLRYGKHLAAFHMQWLERMVTEPDMLALLEASPQARRLLRPLWRALNPRPLPDVLRLPPRLPSEAKSAVALAKTVGLPAPARAASTPPPVRPRRVRPVPRFATGPLVSA